ncbi:hypothetical protein KC19_12G181300 [Ceratodon purpureus]|uniref:Uncharacterized protein n=1 Tax=Ceratodon purpureus TaxID=3225 RepID=A0A8T0G8J9_CERPU|nr:hypothetical protein KC19_12G181300 [Ceratodon purpureus]
MCFNCSFFHQPPLSSSQILLETPNSNFGSSPFLQPFVPSRNPTSPIPPHPNSSTSATQPNTHHLAPPNECHMAQILDMVTIEGKSPSVPSSTIPISQHAHKSSTQTPNASQFTSFLQLWYSLWRALGELQQSFSLESPVRILDVWVLFLRS